MALFFLVLNAGTINLGVLKEPLVSLKVKISNIKLLPKFHCFINELLDTEILSQQHPLATLLLDLLTLGNETFLFLEVCFQLLLGFIYFPNVAFILSKEGHFGSLWDCNSGSGSGTIQEVCHKLIGRWKNTSH